MPSPPVTPTLGLGLPPLHYEPYNDALNANFVLIDTFADSVVSLAPTESQTLQQPAGTYFNLQTLLVFGASASVVFGTNANNWDAAFTRIGPGEFTLDAGLIGGAQAALSLGKLNATQGFQYKGTAPLNHILVGNGDSYVDSASLPAGFAEYQTVQLNSINQTQRANLNFLPAFEVADNPANNSTDVSLAITGVAAGQYTKANVTVAADGRITAVANGAGITAQLFDVTAQRVLDQVYTNAYGVPIYVSGFASTTGSSVGNIACFFGPHGGNLTEVWANQAAATVAGGSAGFHMLVPAGFDYKVVGLGAVNGLSKWTETTMS